MEIKMKVAKGKRKSTFKAVTYMLDFAMKNGKAWLFLKVTEKILRAAYPIALIILPGYIIDELTNQQNTKKLVIYVMMLALTVFIGKVGSDWLSTICFSHKNLLFIKFQKLMIDHIASVDFENLENPRILNLKSSAYKCAYSDGAGFLGIVEKIADFFCDLISLCMISTIIFTLSPLVILILVLFIYLNSIVTKQINIRNHQLDIEKIPFERRSEYFSKIMQDFSYGKEIRVFGLKDFFISNYEKEALQAHRYYKKNLTNNNKVAVVSNIIVLFQTVYVYLYLIYEVIVNHMTIGNFSIYYAAISNFSNSFLHVVSSFLEVSRISLYVDDLIEFMNLPKKQLESGEQHPVYTENSTIEFCDVSFRYSGSELYALHHVNLTLHGNEKLCIVGANGSGKTTFVKLLLRLYTPLSGEIRLDGVNIQEYDYVEYQKLFAPVFQDFKLYAMSIKHNIALDQEEDRKRFEDSNCKSGLDLWLNKLHKKEETQVYKIFHEDGVEPSGGEAQKLGIARAIYRNAPIVLLDEPTAALDPMAEYEIYNRFSEMISDRAAILITHRLSAVQLSDCVAVFHKGELIEYGKHSELLLKKGVYSEMYQKQAEFYLIGDKYS